MFLLMKKKIYWLVNSYGLNGMGSEAIELFNQIPSKYLQESTHVCVLNACSHSGFVNEARSIFENIPIKTEKMFNAMVYKIKFFCLQNIFFKFI